MKNDKISIIQKGKFTPFKKVKIKSFRNTKNNIIFNKKYIIIFSFIFLFLIIQFIIIHNPKSTNKFSFSGNSIKRKYDVNFKYEDYDKEIITDKIKRDAEWLVALKEAEFINGIIRKNKLKNCLEIGVANGGSSILILNSIKDIENSFLVSLDLNKEVFKAPDKLTGYRVNQYFPELTKNWKLYTGDQPHKFLVDLNMKFDFLFLDSAHVSPGEIINFIEALPFLNENAIVVIHDLFWHFLKVKSTKFYPSCISLIPTLYGDKVFLHSDDGDMSNIGAVFLHPNQEEHYIDYFLLLMNFWEYIPTDKQINDLRKFIQKYYKDKKYITIFDRAVRENKNANKKFKKTINEMEERHYLVSLGTKWEINN